MSLKNTRVNINTIAKEAKVSTTTVSNFINGTENFPISAETRKRIRGAMHKYNYRPHVGGSLLRRSEERRRKVGFVMGEDTNQQPFYTATIPLIKRLLCELEVALDELGINLEILRIKNEDSRSEWNAKLLTLDGVINFGQVNQIMCDTLYRRNLPLIEVYSTNKFRWHGDNSDYKDEFDFVFWQNGQQIIDLVKRFYNQGKRNFIFVSSCNIKALRPDYYGYDAEAKLQGFLTAIKKYDDVSGLVLSPRTVDDFNMFREFEFTRELLKYQHKALASADAIICHNDIVAQGVASIAMELGHMPGRDFLLSGEGHFSEFHYWYPSIITSSVDYEVLTREICSLVKIRISGENKEFQTIEVPTIQIEQKVQPKELIEEEVFSKVVACI